MSDKDPFFDDDAEADGDPIPDGLWAHGEPLAKAGFHEWQLIGSAESEMKELEKTGRYVDGKFDGKLFSPTVPVNIFACQVCGLEVECLAWETPSGSLNEEFETCAEVLAKKIHDS